MTRPVVSVLVGLQAAGKSTFARALHSYNSRTVSKDDFPNARRRQARQMRLIDAALNSGHDVIVDNTNPSTQEWAPIIAAGREHGARVVAYFFSPDVNGSRARNAARQDKGPVPDVGFYATLGILKRPSTGDGFDKVYTVHVDGSGGFRVETAEPGG